ncbi:MAG: methyltransferase domain-containing protein [Pseudomonadota bacterium]
MSEEEAQARSEALEAIYEEALRLEKAGEASAAARAWREVLALDETGMCGAAVRLAALGAEASPHIAPRAYVTTLFDQHAGDFDEILVGRLGYRMPEALAERLRALGELPEAPKVLDLGCGTGLVGVALGDWPSHLTGVDLSVRMLEAADAREVYDALYVGDAEGFLEADGEDEEDEDSGPWDLIVAADVMPYLGDLAPLAAACARGLTPGGVLAFTTETLPPKRIGPRGWTVGPHQRFHHDPAYLARILKAQGFEVERMEPAVIRYNTGRPEPGHIVFARLSAPWKAGGIDPATAEA